jgi:flavin-dependent dehydrogenase
LVPCDVIVAGAGPAGSLAAALLARAGARVQLFDRARFPRAKLCGDTLNPGAWRVLAAHAPTGEIGLRSLPLEGMLLTGPGVEVRGAYGKGEAGHALSRIDFDAILLQQALIAGAQFDDGVTLAEPLIELASGRVAGVVSRGSGGQRREHRAAMVIAADGRASRLALALGLSHRPARPRRWAIGGYFAGAGPLEARGEMHVRCDHYIGVAPLPGGLANVCLVTPHPRRDGGWTGRRETLLAAIRADRALADRFARAQLVDEPLMLGPMAVDARGAGVPGMLLAGDAAGFIDPITGDGLRFALEGAAMAAGLVLDVLGGRCDQQQAVNRLAAERRRAFAAKWRFNRAVRSLVASAHAVDAAAAAARLAPFAFERIIRYAGDCGVEFSSSKFKVQS